MSSILVWTHQPAKEIGTFLHHPSDTECCTHAGASTDPDAWRTALNEHKRGLLQQAREMTAEAADLAATLKDAAKQAEAQAAAAACDTLDLMLKREVSCSSCGHA
jgi:hypothetical protein